MAAKKRIMYLIDTNIWLERLLDQEKSEDVDCLLSFLTADQIAISDFSLHSIGVVLDRLKNMAIYKVFIDEVVLEGGVTVVALNACGLKRLEQVIEVNQLDYDDAYQYACAEYHDLDIVSFDSDFDKTPLGRLFPLDVYKK